MLCGSKKTSHSKKQLKRFRKKFRFPDAKLLFFIERFSRMSSSKGISQEQFRENMGLLGLDSTCLIANRIFTVMNKSRSETVSLDEYLEYMDILLYGNDFEKYEQSFKLITNSASDGITFDDFVEWIVNIWKMYNTLTGLEINSSSEDIQYYFDKLDLKKDGIIDLEEYKEAMSENKNLYEWFEFANKGIAEEPIKQIDKETFEKSLEIVHKEVSQCLEILLCERRSSRYFSFKDQDQEFLKENEDRDEPNADYGRPDCNFGDSDLPEEFNIDEESRQSMNLLQSGLTGILASVDKLLNIKNADQAVEIQSRISEPLPMHRLSHASRSNWKVIYNLKGC